MQHTAELHRGRWRRIFVRKEFSWFQSGRQPQRLSLGPLVLYSDSNRTPEEWGAILRRINPPAFPRQLAPTAWDAARAETQSMCHEGRVARPLPSISARGRWIERI